MNLVIIESPFAADSVERAELHLRYARAALRDSIDRGEAPFASHLLYTQVLDDIDPLERAVGINAGLAWYRRATLSAVYDDLGVSRGMGLGIQAARDHGITVVFRKLTPEKLAGLMKGWVVPDKLGDLMKGWTS